MIKVDTEDRIEAAISSINGVAAELSMLEMHLDDMEFASDHVTIPSKALLAECIGGIRMHLEYVASDLMDSISGVKEPESQTDRQTVEQD